MEVSSKLKIYVFEATSDPWVQLYVCEGMSPKSGVFPSFLGQKFITTGFQFFSILYSKLPQWNIFTCTYLYFFGNILHISWSKNKEVGYYASFGELTEEEHNYQLSYFLTKNMQDVTK